LYSLFLCAACKPTSESLWIIQVNNQIGEKGKLWHLVARPEEEEENSNKTHNNNQNIVDKEDIVSDAH